MTDYAFSYLRMSNVGRNNTYLKASSAVAACAYILCAALYDERLGIRCDWTKKESELMASDTVLPEDCSREFSDLAKRNPGRLWNDLEAFEKSEDARTVKEFVIGLPREAESSWISMADDMARYFTGKKYAVTWAIHDKHDGNPHIHMDVSTRQISEDTWCEFKYRKEYALDEHGERIPIIDKVTGEQKKDKRNRLLWKRINVLSNPLDQKDFCKTLKRVWADIANRYLDQESRVDFDHYQEERYIPQQHQGYAATEIRKRIGTSRIYEDNRRTASYTELFILNKTLATDIEIAAAVIAELREKLIQLRVWIRQKINEIVGKDMPDDYIRSVEEIKAGKEPVTVTERAIKNNIQHGIDPYERHAENSRMGIGPANKKLHI